MKFFILLVCLAGALAFSVDDIDFDNLVPFYETDEWRAAHPDMVKMIDQERPYLERVYRNGRIWGGRDALAGELPYQAGIVILGSRQSFCGGSIVSANYILSAAECFIG